jgi:pseudouridine-5'-phosphate glycosidase
MALPSRCVALESTLLLHGVPAAAAPALADELERDVRSQGAHPATVAVVDGEPVVGLSRAELERLLRAGKVAKANLGNLMPLIARRQHAATTVSTTMQLAALAGLRVFATGALGGVHPGFGTSADVSADLTAFTRFPIAVVTAGVKGILDVPATREVLETLGVTVVGFRCDQFPAFYRRQADGFDLPVDVRIDDVGELARFAEAMLARTGRGLVIANPIAPEDELPRDEWERWLAAARARVEAAGVTGRGVTPALLGALHEVSGGATLRANVALVRSNARLAGQIAAGLPG